MRWKAWIAGLALAAGFGAAAQEGFFAPQPAAPASPPSQAELDQLLAPIALYPDVLLGQILAASTYPLEVVTLARWLERNTGLTGEALEAAAAAQPWDPSVRALAQFPEVVATMNRELEWTQRLGDAFLAHEAEVMDAVQRLRRKATDAGGLVDNPRSHVVVDREVIYIEPADPAVVYVPAYDPYVAYGPWWWPAYPPYVWGFAWFGALDYAYGHVYYGHGAHVWPSWYHHPHPDWHGHRLAYNRPGAPSWSHNPIHRGGVPYVDRNVRERYSGADRDRIRERHDFRGFDSSRPSAGSGPRAPRAEQPFARTAPRTEQPFTRTVPRTEQPFARTAPRQSSPPSGFAPTPRDSTRQHAERGRESLRSPSSPQQSHAAPQSRPQQSHSAPQSRPQQSHSAPRSAPPASGSRPSSSQSQSGSRR